MVAAVLLIASNGDLIQSLERKAYDLGVKAASRAPSDRIAVIAIDDQSIANIGRWPWPRDVHAKMTDILSNAKAKTIGYTAFFFEPQVDAGLSYINKLNETFAASRLKGSKEPDIEKLETLLGEAAAALNTDQKLADSFKRANNVLLPIVFQQFPFEPQGNPDKPLPENIAANSIVSKDRNAESLPPPGINPGYPIAELAASAVGFGHLNAQQDVDGASRVEPLMVRYYDRFFPSLSLMLAAKTLNLEVADIQFKLGEEVKLGKLRIRTDPELRMYTFFYGDRDGKSAFPVDSVLDLIYNLALDYERKRQFNKAENAFRYISEKNPKFKDIADRVGRAKAMSETIILGGTGGHPGGTVILPGGGVEKPMLGRYQVEKELGKGAMGVVYLGKDPKIGRVVAIKTMALSQEFEADELQDVKDRFFREAETAGRLNHPNIVTIFDAGEEHDLAFIAMEFLKGKDLAPYIKPDNLLPLQKVLSIITRVAEALSYAHSNNVVHRDIKPANIMYDLESDTVKVTDFGIARITDSSKTKTGMVLGTPSYMSPEQLSGKKIEGVSDLFSLGVTLYQLVSGRLPFQGDSMAQLMFKIANEPHADILTFNPALPQPLVDVINRSLAKEPAERFQTGDEMARAIKACAAEGGEPAAKSDVVDIGL